MEDIVILPTVKKIKCRTCKQRLPHTLEYFPTVSGIGTGLRTRCKKCMAKDRRWSDALMR